MGNVLQTLMSESLVRTPTEPEKREILLTNEFLNNSKTSDGVIREELTSKRACPLCGRNSTKQALNFMGFRWVDCSDCRLWYVSNILKDDFHASDIFSCAIEHMDSDEIKHVVTEQAEETIRYIKKFLPDAGTICDIGCGNGEFLRVLKEKGMSVVGIDVNPEAIRSTRSKGIEAFAIDELDAESLKGLKQPVLFTMRQVIEHVRSVESILKWLDGLALPPWYLIIETPNLWAWSAEKVNFMHRHFLGWVHLQLLSPETMGKISRDMDLDLIHVSTYGGGYGIKTWLEAEYIPWSFNPYGDQSIQRLQSADCSQQTETATQVQHKNSSSILRTYLRRIVGASLRSFDTALRRLSPNKEEYIRAIFVKR